MILNCVDVAERADKMCVVCVVGCEVVLLLLHCNKRQRDIEANICLLLLLLLLLLLFHFFH
jgi:hypothetical protein